MTRWWLKYEFPFFLGELFLKSLRELYIMLLLDFRKGFVEIEGHFCTEIILPPVLNQGYRQTERFRFAML